MQAKVINNLSVGNTLFRVYWREVCIKRYFVSCSFRSLVTNCLLCMVENGKIVEQKENVTERIYRFANADLRILYGEDNVNLRLIKTFFPKIHFVVKGNLMRVSGTENDTSDFLEKMERIEDYCHKFNHLDEEDIRQIVTGNLEKTEGREVGESTPIIYGVNGKPIIPRNRNQQLLVDRFYKNDLVFALGPAGSGKTYIAIALAVSALKNKEVKRIILSRPAVEAGEKLGFLPGEMKDKLDPYLQPLYDALQDMIPTDKLRKYMENNVIQIAPLAYMRGRTLSDAVVILDEAQNTTKHQIKMFLTRLGINAKMIVTGDVTQVDLPPSMMSGLSNALQVLQHVKGIGRVEFTKKDIVRHRLVQKIVEAYEKNEKRQ